MIGFSILAVQVVLWQGQDISVNIVSESEEGVSDVVISVRNTAGSTLLFYENAQLSGKVQYLNNGVWTDFCDVDYTTNNVTAISQRYGGTFAELEPGEDWAVVIPKEKVSLMQNGTYRVKFTYITEKKYNQYLDAQFEAFSTGNESEALTDDSESDLELLNGKQTVSDEPKEDFLAASKSEIFIKTFDYEAPDHFFAEDIVENDIADGDFENITDINGITQEKY